MLGGDESYDNEGDGTPGGPLWDSAREPSATQDDPVAPGVIQRMEATEEPVTRPVPRSAETAVMPPPEPTGDERVDAVLGRLGDLGGSPVAEHVEVFENVQQRLQDVLASIDNEEGTPPQARPGPPGGHP